MSDPLFNVYYIDSTYGDPPRYEGTTNNQRLWIHDHNLDRICEQVGMDAMTVYDKLGLGGKEYASDMTAAWTAALIKDLGYDPDQAIEIADEMESVVEPDHYFEFEEVHIQKYSAKQVRIHESVHG